MTEGEQVVKVWRMRKGPLKDLEELITAKCREVEREVPARPGYEGFGMPRAVGEADYLMRELVMEARVVMDDIPEGGE